MVSIGTPFAFGVVAITVAVLRRTEPKMDRPFRTPEVPPSPIVSAATCLGLMSNLAVETWLRFLRQAGVWLVLGPFLELLAGRTHARLAPGRESEVAEELGADEVV